MNKHLYFFPKIFQNNEMIGEMDLKNEPGSEARYQIFFRKINEAGQVNCGK